MIQRMSSVHPGLIVTAWINLVMLRRVLPIVAPPAAGPDAQKATVAAAHKVIQPFSLF